MKTVTVIYWSGTGNTEKMAEGIVKGLEKNNLNVNLIPVGDAKLDDIIESDALALGCPSMGAEVLESSQMDPFVESLSDKVNNKPVALFGSYDWGSGEWMEDWEARMKSYGASLVENGLTVHLTPTGKDLEACEALGETIANSIQD